MEHIRVYERPITRHPLRMTAAFAAAQLEPGRDAVWTFAYFEDMYSVPGLLASFYGETRWEPDMDINHGYWIPVVNDLYIPHTYHILSHCKTIKVHSTRIYPIQTYIEINVGKS